MVKVSVIVPVYNTEKYLSRCLDSLVGQTLKEIEIIAIDDGSSDSSFAILKEYGEKFPYKIKIFSKENGGQATARNRGIVESIGEYIGFVDSDDCVDCNMFEAMYKTAIQEKYDLVECNYHYLREGRWNKRLKNRGNTRQFTNQKEMFLDPQVSPWNKLYKREVIVEAKIRFPEGLIYEDTAFYIKAIPYIEKEKYVDKRFVYYFLRQSSTMNANKNKKVGNIIPVLEDIIYFYKNNCFFDTYSEELEYFCAKIMLCSSLGRIAGIKDKKTAKELYECTFLFLEHYFPNYRKNVYFTGMIGFYTKRINRKNCPFFGYLYSKVVG